MDIEEAIINLLVEFGLIDEDFSVIHASRLNALIDELIDEILDIE